MTTRTLLAVFAAAMPIAGLLLAQSVASEGQSGLVLRNGKIELTVLKRGATFAKLTVLEDTDRLSPFWKALGHFLCLDGFGAPSDEEKSAGWPFHGEASKQQFEVVQEPLKKGVTTLKLGARLPLAQEAVTRTVTLLDGENVVYVDTEVESLLSVDRPFSWAEHATIGPPFLAPGHTVIDISATDCRVREQKEGSTGKLAYGKDFTWPLAPLTEGGTVDLTKVPTGGPSLDLAACRIDPARANGYITALRPDKHLIFGYVFRRADYPWVMSWMNYTGDAKAARGIEFSTQPFDVSHREAVDAHQMFGAPTYKWLPAKAKLGSGFLFFYANTPDGFGSVADVKLENGRILILDRSGRTVMLNARRSF
ncbi:MAG: hypothetical protein M3Z09_12315 [Acidobacteriota bacterium]|nr:hypothetical protein [Acidobacteriota bacterium]